MPPLTGYDDLRELAEQVRPSGEIIFRYEPTSDIRFYSRFTRGYKGQHFNGNALTTAQTIDPVKAEFVNAFEVGWSTNWLDGVVTWNGAGFYSSLFFMNNNASSTSRRLFLVSTSKGKQFLSAKETSSLIW